MGINKKQVGERIRSIRKSKGMTMEEFGKLFNASKGNVSLWESGSSLPSDERLPSIVELSDKDMSVDELLHGTLAEEVKQYESLAHVFNEDIGKMMQFMIEQLDTDNPNLTFNGEELEDDVKTMLAESLDSTYKMFSKLVK